MNKWIETENSQWELVSENEKKVINAYYHLDEIKIVESNEISNKVVLVTESNYEANQFMLNNYGIEIEFGY